MDYYTLFQGWLLLSPPPRFFAKHIRKHFRLSRNRLQNRVSECVSLVHKHPLLAVARFLSYSYVGSTGQGTQEMMKCYRLPSKNSRSRFSGNCPCGSNTQLGNQLGGSDGTLQLSKVESICCNLGDRQHFINPVVAQLHACLQEVGAGPLSGCAATLAPEVTDDMEDVPFAPIKTNGDYRRTVS